MGTPGEFDPTLDGAINSEGGLKKLEGGRANDVSAIDATSEGVGDRMNAIVTESGFPQMETPNVDKLRRMLGPENVVSTEQAMTMMGLVLKKSAKDPAIGLTEQEYLHYKTLLEAFCRHFIDLMGRGVYGVHTLKGHDAYVFPKIPVMRNEIEVRKTRAANPDLVPTQVPVTIRNMLRRFGAEHFGSTNPWRMNAERYAKEEMQSGATLALRQPFGGRRSDRVNEVERDLRKFNGVDARRFRVSEAVDAVYAVIMHDIREKDPSDRIDNPLVRLPVYRTASKTEGRRAVQVCDFINPPPRQKPLVIVGDPVKCFEPGEGFAVDWTVHSLEEIQALEDGEDDETS